uniref:Uncharacterized protein n=1 Tax=Noctiluca scintillans TaxID=2966 RepID=A0A7S1F606_NOCSC|mmetsp:Transcript_34977/g.93330  ORF Transcript_34977/g.93330 Transcript_34977/m.93330 type:complete len:109 (+) Transcript_34977:634-960(+)
MRAGEQSKSFNRHAAGSTPGVRLAESGAENDKHRFKQVDWKSQIVPRTMKDRPIRGLFAQQPSKIPSEFKQIVILSNASYFSPAPLPSCGSAEDVLTRVPHTIDQRVL